MLSSVTHQIRHYVILIIVTLNHGHVVKQSTCHTDLGGTSFNVLLQYKAIPF